MSRQRLLQGVVGALAVVAAFSFAAAVAFAAPTIAVSHASYANRDVAFTSTYETGTASVALFVDSVEVTRTTVAVARSGVASLKAINIPFKCTVEVAAYNNKGASIAKSAPLVFDGAVYAPLSVGLSLQPNRLVTPRQSFRINTTARVTHATVYVGSKAMWSGPVAVSGGAVQLPFVAVGYGRRAIRVVGSNAWGSKSTATIYVYQLYQSGACRRTHGSC